MAAVTHRVTTPSTSNTTSYPSGSFTPAAGDLLVALVTASGTVAAGSLTNSNGITFTKVTSALKASSADTLYLFVANSLANAVSQTCTFNCTGDAATGAIVSVISISGMTRTGANAVKQSGVQSNRVAAGIPTVTLGAAALTTDPLVGFVGNGSSPSTLTPPTGWSELFDSTGYSAPTTGQEVASVNSGITATVVAWGSTSATAYGAIVAEFDTSIPPRTGMLSTSETGSDTATVVGKVKIAGLVSISEVGVDGLAFSGDVLLQGLLSVSEVGVDAFLGSGALSSGIHGTLTVSEVGTDAATASGDVIVKGTLTGSEVGSDTATAAGKVTVKGALSTSEIGSDTATASGKIKIAGTVSVSEVGSDTATAAGKVTVKGVLVVSETGMDTATAAGKVKITGNLSLVEIGVDGFGAYGGASIPPRTGMLSTSETGSDTATVVGKVKIAGLVSISENGLDNAAVSGVIKIAGLFAVSEAPDDLLAAGIVEISGTLSTSEVGDDSFSGISLAPVSIGVFVISVVRLATLKQNCMPTGKLSDTIVKKATLVSKVTCYE